MSNEESQNKITASEYNNDDANNACDIILCLPLPVVDTTMVVHFDLITCVRVHVHSQYIVLILTKILYVFLLWEF
jgi:hypothetical protein